MKLKLIPLILAAVLTLSFYGCEKKENGTTEGETGAEENGPDLKTNAYDQYNLDEYITLASYKTLTYVKQDPTVSEQQYNDYIAARISENTTSAEVTDRTVQTGDKLQIDYVGTMDDMETPDGMKADDQSLVIGSGSFIPGFEDGLIGANKGDVVTVNVTFPDPYLNNEDLSGKKATFSVTVDAVYQEIVPQFNDDFVRTISDFNTVEEYKSSVMLSLYTENVTNAREAQKAELWDKIITGSTVIKYPDTETQKYSAEMIDYYTDYALNNGYESLEAMLTAVYNTTLEDFHAESRKYAQNTVTEEMVLYSIAKKEDLYLTQEEYNAKAEAYAQMYDFESKEALEEYYGRSVLIKSILWDKTLEHVLGQATAE